MTTPLSTDSQASANGSLNRRRGWKILITNRGCTRFALLVVIIGTFSLNACFLSRSFNKREIREKKDSDPGRIATTAVAVDRAFQEVLLRPSNDTGLITYVLRVMKGSSLDQVKKDLSNSEEGLTASLFEASTQAFIEPQDMHTPRLVHHEMQCACGDFWDAQTQRCFMTDTSVILYFAGYYQERGAFIAFLAPWLAGLISKKSLFTAGHCTKVKRVGSFAWYNYNPAHASDVNAMYRRCNSGTNLVRNCLADVDYTESSGHVVFKNYSRTSLAFPTHGARFVETVCTKTGQCFVVKTLSVVDSSVQMLSRISENIKYQFTPRASNRQWSIIQEFSEWDSSASATLNFYVSSHEACAELRSSSVKRVRGFRESLAHFRAMYWCGVQFAMARFGDGELAVLEGTDYKSFTDLGDWSYRPSNNLTEHRKIVALIMDGFNLAAEHGAAVVVGDEGMYVGLPFYFCAEGMLDHGRGVGGHYDWLLSYLMIFSRALQKVSMTRMVHSWQWGNLNYPAAMDFFQEIGRSGRLVLVCNEEIRKHEGTLPEWVQVVLTVPGSAMQWLASDVEKIKRQAEGIARSFRGHIFAFSAGPVSNVLIPLMWRANPANTYIDFGGSLDLTVQGTATRAFQSWSQGGRNQEELASECHETRWNVLWHGRYGPQVVADPIPIPVDLGESHSASTNSE
eukprot:CAMPEP_0206275502 /NCGR_PEP_ID=MMETSP0047_2-20121206/35793_1 /ASSEMBLY_ACC=CAM_ASM_000192 /TAXON_ID=195065 /ORGANISM="Chroomonas mesostigmatica_cf, Strain CCMP1168" /LENGTH=680 /DNA_ID=CAMNT_0053704929 /DNA_START=20 /DNA_END=2062 /DNA_ORIENTATION=-